MAEMTDQEIGLERAAAFADGRDSARREAQHIIEMAEALQSEATGISTRLRGDLDTANAQMSVLRKQVAYHRRENQRQQATVRIIQDALVQCQQHRPLCIHEQDALKVANDALCGITECTTSS